MFDWSFFFLYRSIIHIVRLGKLVPVLYPGLIALVPYRTLGEIGHFEGGRGGMIGFIVIGAHS